MFLHKMLTVDHFIHFLNSFFSLISLPYVIVEIASIDDFLLELSLILKIECYVSCTMSQAVLEMSLSIMSKRETSISNDVISSNHNYCLLNESLLSLKLFMFYPRNWRRDWEWLLRKKRSQALHLSMISSDESDGEDDTLSTKHLVWRAEELSSFLNELDLRHRANMSTQQRRQSVNRQVGRPSTRSHHEAPEKLLWAIKL